MRTAQIGPDLRLDIDVNLLISVLIYRLDKGMMENRILKLQQDLVIPRCRGRLT